MIAYMAKKYATGFVSDEPLRRGQLAEGERRDLLVVLKGGHCYRVLGAGDTGVSDMDLFLFDPSGVLTHQDPGQDPLPVLGLQPHLCTGQAGSYRLQVLMYEGGGDYALQVYRTEQ